MNDPVAEVPPTEPEKAPAAAPEGSAAPSEPVEAAKAPEAAAADQAPPEPVRIAPSIDPGHFVVKVTTYVDNAGRQVDHREPQWGPEPVGFDLFSGVGDVAFTYPNGQKKTQQARFPLKGAKTLKEAFDMYEVAFDTVHEETQKQFDAHVAMLEARAETERKEAARQAIASGKGPGNWRPPGGIIRPR